MCPKVEKFCNICHKKLSHNNKLGFCLQCLPTDNIVKLFKDGKTISDISTQVFNSISGSYRDLIRNILKEKLGSSFLELRKKNKAKQIYEKRLKRLPLDFIKNLHNEGKLTTQIHQALLKKGYKLHVQTLRNVLKHYNLDYTNNYHKWLTNRGKISKKRKKLIKELWVNGNSIRRISKSTGLAQLTVKQYLHQMGFKTKLLQIYYSESQNKEEEQARKHLENSGYTVKRCLFICQRKLDKPFNEILNDSNFPFPKRLRQFCKGCPIKDIKFEEQEMYDFVFRKDGHYGVAEVKKVYHDPYRRAHFSLGQFLNLPKILKSGIPFKLIIFDKGVLHEKEF